ncbi:MAG: hypothetical protein WCH11_03935 [Bdellovibrio sp.]
MSWSDSIDIYCERLGPEFWSEPINAWTNLGFIVAGILVWKRGASPVLSVLLVLIGICSFWFHTSATRWAAALDSLAILVFALAYLFIYLRQVLKWSSLNCWISCIFFSALNFVFPFLFSRFSTLSLNGSEAYLPYLIVLLGFSLQAGLQKSSVRQGLWLASFLFVISMTLRSLDEALCDRFPMGTHFIWHLCNSVMLFVLARDLPPRTSELSTSKSKFL